MGFRTLFILFAIIHFMIGAGVLTFSPEALKDMFGISFDAQMQRFYGSQMNILGAMGAGASFLRDHASRRVMCLSLLSGSFLVGFSQMLHDTSDRLPDLLEAVQHIDLATFVDKTPAEMIYLALAGIWGFLSMSDRSVHKSRDNYYT